MVKKVALHFLYLLIGLIVLALIIAFFCYIVDPYFPYIIVGCFALFVIGIAYFLGRSVMGKGPDQS